MGSWCLKQDSDINSSSGSKKVKKSYSKDSINFGSSLLADYDKRSKISDNRHRKWPLKQQDMLCIKFAYRNFDLDRGFLDYFELEECLSTIRFDFSDVEDEKYLNYVIKYIEEIGEMGYFKIIIWHFNNLISKDLLEKLLKNFKLSNFESLEIRKCNLYEDSNIENIKHENMRSSVKIKKNGAEKFNISIHGWKLGDKHKQMIDETYLYLECPPILKIIGTNDFTSDTIESMKQKYDDIYFEIKNDTSNRGSVSTAKNSEIEFIAPLEAQSSRHHIGSEQSGPEQS